MHKRQKDTPRQKPTHGEKRETGKIRIAGKGTGFVELPNREQDVVIEQENLNTAMHNDTVEIRILPKKSHGRVAGTVTKIITRAKTEFVGTLVKEGGKLFLIPDDKKVYRDFLIQNAPTGSDVGQKALVKMRPWTDDRKNPEAEIIKIIGKKGVHDVEMTSIVLEKGFDTIYPPEVMAEADAIAKNSGNFTREEISTRRDFRNTLTFTIDPADAKDFDDAISFQKLPNGNLEIGVHIADVSHYVREKSALDGEARKRGFSVYLVDRTIPMLPEALSNIVCSLNPNEDRLTFSAVFEMTTEGVVKKRWFGKTIIRSAKRFTYEDAQAVLDGTSNTYRTELLTLNNIAQRLRDEKFKKGAIDFEQDEIRFTLDENGVPTEIHKKQRLDTHKLVEEFMLLANREVATFIWNARDAKKSSEPFLYRIHDIPDRARLENLAIFVRALGYELPIRKGTVTAKDLQILFEKISGRAEEALIKTAAVRSMAKAIYSTLNIGHFGLSFDYYTHFTSPIRRYADLLVHRILFHHLRGTHIPAHEWHSYEKMARHNSEQEIAAAEAERTSRKLKQVEYMAKRIGQTFDGVISGVTEWGMYIEERETRCEGMVKMRDLPDDYYVLDEKNYAIVGERTKRRFALGDRIRFKVAAADIERKTLDYRLA